MDDKLKPVERSKNLKEQAYEKIKEAILEGGETVAGHSESQLAKVLHISRTPVREALLLLAKEGLVKLLPQRGVLVLQLTQDGLEEVFELRAALETLTVEKLAKTLSLSDLKRLKELVSRQRQAANLKN
ncbi:MAG TPA: GntR family transcriptional regulator, partial [bacterium]|nr:GntR family transcriptional regulator [bacterium]